MFVLTDILAFDPHNSAMKSELLLHLRKLQLREGQYSIQAYMTEYMGRQSLLYSETFHLPVMVSPSPQDCRASLHTAKSHMTHGVHLSVFHLDVSQESVFVVIILHTT